MLKLLDQIKRYVKLANKILYGSYKEQYKMLSQYLGEVKFNYINYSTNYHLFIFFEILMK